MHINKQPYRIANIERGTDAWHDWRNQGLGSSDAPIIMGESLWRDWGNLLHEKKHRIKLPTSAARARSIELEPEARSRYEERTGIKVLPVCLESTNVNWLRASVNGLSEDRCSVVKITCDENAYKKSAASGQIPRYYMGQLQHILALTGLEKIDFWCYAQGRDEVHLSMERDEGYIKDLLVAEEEFWEELQGWVGELLLALR